MKNLFLFALSLLLIVGCGKGFVPMHGHVTFSDTGEPLQHGTVIFHKDGFQAKGALDTDGKYTIGSFSEKDGLPAGDYVVYILASSRIVENPRGGIDEIPRIDRKFTSPETSGLKVQVDGKNRVYDFQVDRPQVDPRKK